MNQAELRQLLSDFAADRLALVERHEAAARAVSHYDFNNAYQYVINREEVQLGWLQAALAEFKAPLPPPSSAITAPEAPPPGKGKTTAGSAFRVILQDDVQLLSRFVARWKPRVEAMSQARHRLMLDVILGESREHLGIFEQAAEGVEDVLGRRTGGVPRRGNVLPVRWLE